MSKKYQLKRINRTTETSGSSNLIDKVVKEDDFEIDYINELNPAQFEAVSSLDGAYLVIAGAGTGKTRTLVYRVQD